MANAGTEPVARETALPAREDPLINEIKGLAAEVRKQNGAGDNQEATTSPKPPEEKEERDLTQGTMKSQLEVLEGGVPKSKKLIMSPSGLPE